MTVVIPWPPTTGNHQHGIGRYGQIYTKPEVVGWIRNTLLTIEPIDLPPENPKIIKDLRLVVKFFAPDKRRRDSDNVLKPVRDLLAKAWSVDDKRFLVTEETWEVSKDNPRLEIEVWSCMEDYKRQGRHSL